MTRSTMLSVQISPSQNFPSSMRIHPLARRGMQKEWCASGFNKYMRSSLRRIRPQRFSRGPSLATRSAGATANLKLTFYLDHSTVADHSSKAMKSGKCVLNYRAA